MKKIAIGSTLSLLLASGALAQAPAPEANEPTPNDATPAPSESAAPAAALPPVAEESFDTSAFEAGGADATLSAEELEKLGFGGGSPAVDTDIKVFGFADVNFAFIPLAKDNPWRKALQPNSQFFVGNFNLYLSKNLSDKVRTMSEVRFHYAPHGSNDPAGGIINNQYGDPSDFNRPVHLGGIEIERIYLEWSMLPQLSVRVGQFLTPYGIWNVDHGSPIIIPVARPYVIGSALFPERQTGLEFLGRSDLSTDNTIGYHVTLSNGMGPISELRDFDENKGVGGRLFWENRALGTLRIGGSIFYAKDTAVTPAAGLAADMTHLDFNNRVTSESKVLSLAADLQWRYRGVHLQSELITQQRQYVHGGRQASANPFTGQSVFPVDYTSIGAYALLGYGFDVNWLNIMPYIMYNYIDLRDSTFLLTKAHALVAGINFRPIDALVVKFSYAYASWPDGNLITDKAYHSLASQIAWAF